MAINANMIKELRNKTGAGMLDCKKALQKTNGNMEESITWLRKNCLASAGKKAERPANDGVVATFVDGHSATIIELSSETDFVGKNEKFLNLAATVVNNAHTFDSNSIPAFLKSKMSGSTTSINDLIAKHISIMGENIILKKLGKINIQSGKIISYLHNKLADNIGKIAVLVAIEGEINQEIEEFGRQLAMHIAASNPIALNKESLDPEIIKNETSVLREQALDSGKLLEEIVLLEQIFILDGKTKIRKIIEDLVNKTNCKFSVSGYIRYEVGKG
jgi:elongation factor Ts